MDQLSSPNLKQLAKSYQISNKCTKKADIVAALLNFVSSQKSAFGSSIADHLLVKALDLLGSSFGYLDNNEQAEWLRLTMKVSQSSVVSTFHTFAPLITRSQHYKMKFYH